MRVRSTLLELQFREANLGQLTLAASPPVAANSAPVTSAAASEARKTATGEMSSGCSQPTCSGTVGARASQVSCAVGYGGDGLFDCAMAARKRLLVIGERGTDQTGQDGVDGNIVGAELQRSGLHQAENAPLRCRVGGAVLRPHASLHRRKQDEAALLARHHLRTKGAYGVGGTVEIILDLVAPIVVIHFHQRLPALDGSVGDDDVDLAVRGVDLISDPAEGGDVANIGLDRNGAAAVVLDASDGLGELRFSCGDRIRSRADGSGDVEGDDVSSVCRKFDGNSAADSTSGAGDDRTLSRKR